MDSDNRARPESYLAVNSDTPDQHGFVMLGLCDLFLHHLPMFGMQNHRYQVILAATLPAYAMTEYLSDRARNAEELYILGNIHTDLFTLAQIQNREIDSFMADIFRGVPLNPNTDPPLVHKVQVDVDQIIYFREFDESQEYPGTLTYLIFGA